MASHFSANQYEDAFNPKKLRNWTVPRKYKEHPSTLEGYTQIIANNRGHLLDVAPKSKESPWGTFMGTWDMPCKIPPVQPSYTARSPDAAKHLYKQRQTSSLNNAVNGYKKFEKTRKSKTSPLPRPHAPTPPCSDEKAPKASAGTQTKSPVAEAPKPSARSPTKSPHSPKVATPTKSPVRKTPSPAHRGGSPHSKPPTPARSVSPRSNRSASPRPESQQDLLDDTRSIGSAHTV